MSTDSDFREIMHEQRRYVARELEAVIQQAEIKTTIDFYAKVKIDDYGTVRVGEWGGYYIEIMPMAFNHRLVMSPISMPLVYDYGWCYPKGVAPLMAALIWNPQREGEPKGFIKRIGVVARMPGLRAAGWQEDLDRPNG